ncbi:MAG: hypothetical protein KGJ44_02980 [Betaproteobacteria bacterium]|nr:hypothetical protein [Betaproteobacteria bacterium]
MQGAPKLDIAAAAADSGSLVLSGWLATSPYLLQIEHPAAWFVLMLAALIVAMEAHAPAMPRVLRTGALAFASALLLAGPWTLGFAQEPLALWDATGAGVLLLICAVALLRWLLAQRRRLRALTGRR